MRKTEVTSAFCNLATHVARNKYQHQYAADCFCGDKKTRTHFEFDEIIFEYIRQAVYEKLARDKEEEA